MAEPGSSTPPVANLELKATLLLVLMALLVAGAVLYVLYARGVFEATQRLVLIAENSEGVVVGMDLTFAGFPIGRVRRIELGEEGNARIVIDVPRRDARWLRESSVFTLERGLLGNTALRAYTGIPTDPPLPAGAVRSVLIGDATTEIPRLVNSTRDLVQNLTALVAADAPLAVSLANVQTATAKLEGKHGALGFLLGNETDARKVVTAIERTNALLARADGAMARVDSMVARVDGVIARTEAQLLGEDGVVRDVRATVNQLNAALGDARAVLGDVRTTLKGADGVLEEVLAVTKNTRAATTDLGVMRAQVEANLRKVEHLLNEINRKWPFARDTELKLP